MAAFLGNPVLAYKEKGLIFTHYHDEIFPQDIRAETVLFAWFCGELCKPVVYEHMKKSSDEAKILKRGGYLFALAVMAEVLRIRNGATYLSALKEDQITSSRGKERLTKYAEYAVSLYLQAIEDEVEVQQKEVTTLIRTKDAFDKVIKRAKRQFDRESMNKEWLKGSLPKLVS